MVKIRTKCPKVAYQKKFFNISISNTKLFIMNTIMNVIGDYT